MKLNQNSSFSKIILTCCPSTGLKCKVEKILKCRKFVVYASTCVKVTIDKSKFSWFRRDQIKKKNYILYLSERRFQEARYRIHNPISKYIHYFPSLVHLNQPSDSRYLYLCIHIYFYVFLFRHCHGLRAKKCLSPISLLTPSSFSAPSFYFILYQISPLQIQNKTKKQNNLIPTLSLKEMEVFSFYVVLCTREHLIFGSPHSSDVLSSILFPFSEYMNIFHAVHI